MSSPDPLVSETPPKASHARGGWVLVVVLFIFVAAGLAVYFEMPEIGRFLSSSEMGDPSNAKIIDFERRLELLERQTNDLTSRMEVVTNTNPSDAVSSKTSNPSSISPAELARLQSEVTNLSTAVNGFGASLRETGALAGAARTEAREALAQGFALIQLREKAMSGHGFTAELSAMKNAAAADAHFEEGLNQLAPYADQGAPMPPQLREELDRQAGHANVEIAKSNAQSWWERILAELSGLISIRPLHGGSQNNDTFAAIDADLMREDVTSALAHFKNLPPEAQKVLSEWQVKAEARQHIEGGLVQLSGALMAKTSASQAFVAPSAVPPSPSVPKTIPAVALPSEPAPAAKSKIIPKSRHEPEEPSEETGTDQDAP